MNPVTRPTLLFWFLSVLPFFAAALFPLDLPFSDSRLLHQGVLWGGAIYSLLLLGVVLLRDRFSRAGLKRLHFLLPLSIFVLIPVTWGVWAGLSAYDRLWYFLEIFSLLLWVLPLSAHLGVKLGVYERHKSHRGLIAYLIIKCLAILEVSIAAGFFTFNLLVDIPIAMKGSLIIINLLIQLPLLIPFIAFVVRLGRPMRHIYEKKWEASPLAIAFRRTQLYAYLLITITLIYSIMSFMLFVVVGHLYFGLTLQLLLSLITIVFLFVLGGQLYGFLSLRRELVAILRHISRSGLVDHSKVRSPVSLRFKLGIWFGLLVFIATAFSAYWSYVQYGKLVSEFLSNKAGKQLENFENTLWERSSRFSEADIIASVNRLVKEYASYDDGIYYHFPTRGRLFAMAQGNSGVPRFTVRLRSRMRRERFGEIKLPESALYGAFRALYHNGNRVGVVALIYRQNNPFHAAGVGRSGRLILFFIILFIIGTGGVVYFVAEFTRPLKRLEGNVAAITTGRFTELVRPEGEADEIGRLSFTLESMRRTIHDKISTIERLNLNLESMVEDRTEDLRVTNEELIEALAELEKAQEQLVVTGRLAALGKLLAGIAHEINNPINAITNAINPLSSLLTEMEGGGAPVEDVADARAMVKVISRGTVRIREVVERITTTLRPHDTPVVPVDLHEVFDNSLSLISHRLTGVEVLPHFAPGSVVMAHFGPLGQVFENIMVNASGAMEGCAVRRLTVTSERDGGMIKVVFSDTGVGIPDDIREKIFDPFFTTKEEGKGMGLGLSIVHDIVSRYSGTLTVESSEGEGTVITVHLPAAV